MTITVSQFRSSTGAAFANAATFPDGQIQFYLDFAYKMLIPDRWGNVIDEGATLFAEHFLTLDRIAGAGGAGGGIAGTAVGVLTGGTVDKVSYTRDVQSVLEEKAGHWGMTIYGNVYLRLARMMGAGPIQVGVLNAADSQYGGAWPGPYQGPW